MHILPCTRHLRFRLFKSSYISWEASGALLVLFRGLYNVWPLERKITE